MLNAYRRFKKNTPLRRFATPSIVRTVKKIELAANSLIRNTTKIEHRSKYQAVAHVGLQKTGTVWFREMFSDPFLYRYSGLCFVDCAGKRDAFDLAGGGIFAPIREISQNVVDQISQPGTATVFVVRNPLSITLSWLNSTENYHITGKGDAGMTERRSELSKRDLAGKIDYALDYFKAERRFEKIERLLELAEHNSGILVVRYEDCVTDSDRAFGRIFTHLDFAVPASERAQFIRTHSFKSYSGRAIDEKAKAGSALQGQTHLKIDALPTPDKDRIFSAVGERFASFYKPSPNPSVSAMR